MRKQRRHRSAVTRRKAVIPGGRERQIIANQTTRCCTPSCAGRWDDVALRFCRCAEDTQAHALPGTGTNGRTKPRRCPPLTWVTLRGRGGLAAGSDSTQCPNRSCACDRPVRLRSRVSCYLAHLAPRQRRGPRPRPPADARQTGQRTPLACRRAHSQWPGRQTQRPTRGAQIQWPGAQRPQWGPRRT